MDSLPEELILNIASNLIGYLWALSVTSRQLNRIANEVLYKDVDLPSNWSTFRFLRTIIENPTFATTESLVVSERRDDGSNEQRRTRWICRDLLRKYESLGSTYIDLFAGDGNRDYSEKERKACLMLLLSALPRLRELHMTESPNPFSLFHCFLPIRMLRAGVKDHFEHLKTLRLSTNSANGVIDIRERDLLRIFQLPNLVTLVSTSPLMSSRALKMLQWPQRTSPIENIQLIDTFVGDPVLTKMIGACRSLKTLVYQPQRQSGSDAEMPRTRISNFAGTLTSQSASLESLTVDVDEHLRDFPLGSLHDFNIREIQMPLLRQTFYCPALNTSINPHTRMEMKAEFHQGLLPRAMEKLVILRGGGYRVPALTCLSEHCARKWYPNLQSVVVHDKTTIFDDVDMNELKQVIGSFRGVGVEISFPDTEDRRYDESEELEESEESEED